MAGIPTSGFTEAVRLTGNTVFTGPRDVVNDSQKNNYNTMGYLARGQKMSDVIKGGINVVDDIFLAAVRKMRTYRPGQKQSYSNPQTGVQISVPWRQFITDITWDDTERELNEGAAREGNRSIQLKNLWFKKQMEAYSDACDFWEEQYWLPADKTRMEDANGDLMYSIPALVNEYANGLPISTHPGGAWTTKCGINPTLPGYGNWAPQRFGYANLNTSYVGTGTAMGSTSLLAQIKLAFQKLDFRPPPNWQEYFESPSAKPAGFIACNAAARTLVWSMYQAAQNRWVNDMDPNGNPMFDGVPYVYIAALDNAAIYATGSADALSTDGDTSGSNYFAGPRFWMLQPDYLRQYWHEKFTMKSLGVMDDRAQPTSHTMPILSWTNLMPRSLRRQGILYPTTDISGYSGG